MSGTIFDPNYLARKRGRLSNADSSNSLSYTDVLGVTGRKRDEELWYEDGTVILLAQEVEFRIYKGLLADHFPVFKSMFSTAPSATTESNTPVCHLTDSPEDLRHILRMCVRVGHSSPFAHDHPSFDAISASIRVGQKYQMTWLVEHALGYLREYYTDDFNEWEDTDCSPPGFSPEHAIGVVNLARLTGMNSLLPTALLVCCGLGKSLVNGFERAVGCREYLTLDDIGLCFEARGKITHAGVAMALRVCTPKVSSKCQTRGGCWKALRRLAANLHRSSKVLCGTDPFASLSELYEDATVCSACVAVLEERDRKARRHLWKHLPAWFGLSVEGWGKENESVSPGDSEV